MTYEQAQDFYIKATGIKPLETAREDWFKYNPEALTAISDLLEMDEFVTNLGGELKSRQVVAFVIHNAIQKARNERT